MTYTVGRLAIDDRQAAQALGAAWDSGHLGVLRLLNARSVPILSRCRDCRDRSHGERQRGRQHLAIHFCFPRSNAVLPALKS